jgi:hypothetical protein
MRPLASPGAPFGEELPARESHCASREKQPRQVLAGAVHRWR